MTRILPLRLLIVEDHELVRQGLAYTLNEHGFESIDCVDDGKKALERCQQQENRPELILMDIGLPILDGISATQAIKKTAPDVKIIMLTSHQDPMEVRAALTAGADGYCLKDIPIERLCRVMEDLMEGGLWLDPAVAQALQQWIVAIPNHPGVSPEATPDPGLTEREREVLAEIVNGKSNKEIAVYLGMSPHTVKTHVTNVIQKLSVTDRTQAAVKAIKQQLV
ncbi:MAG: response regulator transcription factor [Vampirovibrionales bacterium]|nr:response regulator transcription factor [Vampirovibrionales bacterium]